MRIGVPAESKTMEFRIGLLPDVVRGLCAAGHEVIIQQGAGEGSGFADDSFTRAGARLVSREEVWSTPELIVKVKEPQPDEVGWLREGQVLFTYLHLAASRELAENLRDTGVIAIAYETIQNPDGTFPVLAPMSEVAGRLAAQIGVTLLQKDHGGKGLLLGGVPGVMRGRVCILGGGSVGINALRVAHALGAEVDVFDVDLRRLTYLYDIFHGELNTLYANPAGIERSVLAADLVIGAVYLSGRRAPILVDDALVARMEPGSVIVDVAVDQGGCIETIHPTTHAAPTYEHHGVVHYGVANMPAAVPRTSTQALVNATAPFVERLAALGAKGAIEESPALAHGANLWRGKVVHPGVADSLGLPYTPLDRAV
jgi:alanine dehydrogenase